MGGTSGLGISGVEILNNEYYNQSFIYLFCFIIERALVRVLLTAVMMEISQTLKRIKCKATITYYTRIYLKYMYTCTIAWTIPLAKYDSAILVQLIEQKGLGHCLNYD